MKRKFSAALACACMFPATAEAQEPAAPLTTEQAQAEKPKLQDPEPQRQSAPRVFALTVERSLSANADLGTERGSVPLPGLGVTWRLSDLVGLQAIAAFGYSRATATSPVTSSANQTVLGGAARLVLWPLHLGKFRFGMFAGAGYRVAFETQAASGAGGTQTRQGFGFEVGIRPEYQFSSRVSLHTSFGAALTANYFDSGANNLTLGFSGDVVSQAGISVWF